MRVAWDLSILVSLFKSHFYFLLLFKKKKKEKEKTKKKLQGGKKDKCFFRSNETTATLDFFSSFFTAETTATLDSCGLCRSIPIP
jgi:hypothetical protein